jgi:hypothetical protein
VTISRSSAHSTNAKASPGWPRIEDDPVHNKGKGADFDCPEASEPGAATTPHALSVGPFVRRPLLRTAGSERGCSGDWESLALAAARAAPSVASNR